MNEGRKRALASYIKNRELLKGEVIQLIAKLKIEGSEERDLFKKFLEENIAKNDLIDNVATFTIMDILKELYYPNAIEDDFDQLFLEVLYGESYEVFDTGFDTDHLLLYENDFSCLGAFSGNAFAFNFNKENPEIVYIDHSEVYASEDDLEELYSEHYGFYFDHDTNSYVNENGLLLDKIYDEDGNYNIHSEYIIAYLNEIPSRGLSYHSFANYVIEKMTSKYVELFQ